MLSNRVITDKKVKPLTKEETNCAILLFKDSVEAARDCVKKTYSEADIELMQRFIDNYNRFEQS